MNAHSLCAKINQEQVASEDYTDVTNLDELIEKLEMQDSFNDLGPRKQLSMNDNIKIKRVSQF